MMRTQLVQLPWAREAAGVGSARRDVSAQTLSLSPLSHLEAAGDALGADHVPEALGLGREGGWRVWAAAARRLFSPRPSPSPPLTCHTPV